MGAPQPLPNPAGVLTLVRALGEQMVEGHGLAALDGAGSILVATSTARRLLRLPEDCEGHKISAVGADFRLARVFEACRNAGEAVERELSDPQTDIVIRAFPVADAPVAMIMLVRDETRLRRLERVRRDFVTNVSHELRTPITAIRLLVETLEKGALGDREAAAGFVQRIGHEVGHMAQMVEELLELSTIESGQLPLRIAPVSVAELITAIDRLRPLAEERSIQIAVEVDPATPRVLGDAARLGQVLRNLVHNAIKFTPPGGRIAVTAAEAESGQVVQLQCRDTGVGIRPEDLPRIFERFWKADSSRQRDGEGSGLGLAIARHVVEAHGGRIRVISQPRRGATFIVDLPALEAGSDGRAPVP